MGIDALETRRRFEKLAARLLTNPMVAEGTGFGASRGLRVQGRIFAIFGLHDLTVKLPRSRVDELVATGIGQRYDPGHGRVMKEWLTVPPEHGDDWERLAEEALIFVGPLPDDHHE